MLNRFHLYEVRTNDLRLLFSSSLESARGSIEALICARLQVMIVRMHLDVRLNLGVSRAVLTDQAAPVPLQQKSRHRSWGR
jgi:hypothetical protein